MAALIPSASATGSGTMTLAGPSTNSNQTITIPDATGTMMVSGNMPAFSAYQSSAQTLTGSVVTKILFQTEEFDTNNNFASSTFTPTVAGYYQVTGGIQVNAVVTVINVFLYKNGALYKFLVTSNNATLSGGYGTSLVYLNGSTDYVEIYASVGTGQALNVNGTAGSYFNGAMVRAA